MFGSTMGALANVRVRFFLSLGVLGSACLILMAQVAFHPDVALWVGFGIALGALALASALLADAIHRRELGLPRELRIGRVGVRVWPMLAWAMVVLSAWLASAEQAFAAHVARWVGFGSAWALVAVAALALIVHEISTERVVHVLEVTEGGGHHPSRAAG
jgi:hypothetical protein